ncbi:MAG: hypothetical protein J6W64_00730 [Bacilli bacterium]|nr:hypothetical protein [Bacilli bacterium]
MKKSNKKRLKGDKLGICIKSKDWRYDATQKNKRIPNDAQFNAIEAAMKEFKMIA